MKILMLGLFNPIQNTGKKVHFFEVAYSLHKKGHHVSCVIPAGKIDKRFFNNLDIISLPLEYKENIFWIIMLNIIQFYMAIKALTDSYDIIYHRYIFLPSSLLRYLGRKLQLFPLLISEHNNWYERKFKIIGSNSLLKNIVRKYQIKDALSADFIITTNDGSKDMLTFNTIPKAKVLTIQNGCNLEQFFPLSREKRLHLKNNILHLRDDDIVLGYIGDISNLQTINDLIDCYLLLFNHYPVVLLIIGSGKNLQKLEEKVLGTNTQNRIIIRENVPYEELNMWINCIDIAFIPLAKEMDNFASPIKLREFAAVGLPVITSKAKGLREFEKTGWLHSYNFNDIEELKQLIIGYLKNREQMKIDGNLAHDYALENFSWDKVSDMIISVINELKKNQSNKAE